jgi:hypothetical protein
MDEPMSRDQILVKARAARALKKHRRWAEEMRAAGWTCTEPSVSADTRTGKPIGNGA